MPEISLGVRSDTKQAQQDVSTLTRALKDLQSVAEGIGRGGNIADYGKQIKSATNAIASINNKANIAKTLDAFNQTPNMSNLTKFANAVSTEYNRAAKEVSASNREMGDSAKRTGGIFNNFFGSLTRIAKLRLLRGIIRALTQAFKEGTENIYQYSAALGSADASHFKSTMDGLASSFLYLKNSIGAVVAPLLGALVPALQTVISWVALALDYVAQFFAVINGQSTYSRAKQQATEWKAIEGAAGGAAAAAKEYKNTILGFDELNVLNDPSQGGGGGGGGASAPDYSSMFEEVELPKNIFTSIAKLFSKDGIIGKAASFAKDTLTFAIEGIGPALSFLWGTLTGDIEMANRAWEELHQAIARNKTAQTMMTTGMRVYKFFGQAIDDIKWMFLNSLQDILNFYGPVLEIFGVDVDGLTQKIGDQKQKIQDHKTELDKQITWFKFWASGLSEVEATMATNAVYYMVDGIKAFQGVGKSAKDTKTDVDKVKTATDYSKDAWGYYAQAVFNAQQTKYDGSNATSGLSNVCWWADNATWKINNTRSALGNLAATAVASVLSGFNIAVNVVKGGLAKGGFVDGFANGGFIPSYASGGINSADLFTMNENGNAEMLGKIGSRTAVANQGQLVEALAQGLERSFTNMTGGNSNIEVVVQMDGVAVARANDRGQKALNRRFNVQLA